MQVKSYILGVSAAALCLGSFSALSYAASGYQFDRAVSSHVILTSSEDQVLAGGEAFINDLATKAVGFLGNENLSEVGKKREFRELLKAKFDMRTIGRFALGRYWRVATKAEQTEYQKLFEAMIVEVYSNRFAEYGGQNVEVRKSRKDSEKDLTITSFIVSDGGPEIQLDWRLRYKNGRYRVIDVVVEGVSMAVTQRSDFSSVIQRGGGQVAVLLDHLRG